MEVLPVEMGSSGVMRKEFQGYTHGRLFRIVARFIEEKKKSPWGWRGRAGSTSNCPEVLAVPPYSFLVSGTSRLSSKLFNCFLGFPWAMLGPPPIQSLYWIFWGSHTFILSNSLSKFSQARLLPFMVTILAPTEHAPNFCFILLYCACPWEKDLLLCHLGFYLLGPSKGLSPLLFNPLPCNPG